MTILRVGAAAIARPAGTPGKVGMPMQADLITCRNEKRAHTAAGGPSIAWSEGARCLDVGSE